MTYLLKINKRIKDLRIILGTFLCLILFFVNLPWYQPVTLIASGTEAVVSLRLKRSNGEVLERTYDLQQTGPELKISRQAVLEVNVLSGNVTIKKVESAREGWTASVYFASIISALLITGFLTYVTWLLRSASSYLALVIHGSLMTIFFFGTFPGLYNFDSFAYLNTQIASPNEFVGLIFGSLFLTLYECFPAPWIFSLLNAVVATSALFHLGIMARKGKVEGWYWLACAVFYCYPGNLLLNFSANRDILSSWLFTILSFQYYFAHLEDDFENQKSRILRWTSGTALFRPETLFVLLSYVAVSYRWLKGHWRWVYSLVVLLLILPMLQKGLEVLGVNTSGKLIHQTTLVVNPLSYILKHKYGQVPEDIDKALGPYFKNDYLVTYQSDLEIRPVHQGGANHFGPDEEKERFRNEAFKIIIKNPVLWLENRWKMSMGLLGFTSRYIYVATDGYGDGNPFFESIRIENSLPTYDLTSGFRKGVMKLLSLPERYPSYLLKSYLIPVLFLLLSLWLTRGGGAFGKVLPLQLIRLVVVFVSAPAAYYKYNFTFWIFAVFAFPFAIQEFRKSRANRSVTNTL